MRRGRASARSGALAALVVLAIAALCTESVHAGGTAEAERQQRRRELLAELDQTDVTFPVVIAAVVAPEASDAERMTLGSYAEVVRDLATGPEVHYLEGSQRRIWADEVIGRYRRDLQEQWETRRRALERRRLEAASVESPAADDELDRLAAELALVDTISADDVGVPDAIPVVMLDGPRRFRRVLPAADGLAREFPDARLILYLTVEPVGDLFLVRVNAFSPLDGADRELFRVVGTSEEIPGRLETQERRIVEAVSGRPLGGLRVTVTDPSGEQRDDARVFLSGEYRGVAPLSDRYLLPGSYDLQVRLPDGRRASQLVDIEADVIRGATISIDAPPPAEVTIRSVPAGARVYRGSLWVGFTPVAVPRSPDTVSYTLALDGYYDSRVTLSPGSPPEVERVLLSTDTDWAAEVTDARDRFYRSFGLFALSVSVPILVNGAYQNYTGLLAADGSGALSGDLSAAEQDRILRQADALYAGYYAGVGLSAGLFGNMIWRLITYVRTAQGYHTR